MILILCGNNDADAPDNMQPPTNSPAMAHNDQSQPMTKVLHLMNLHKGAHWIYLVYIAHHFCIITDEGGSG